MPVGACCNLRLAPALMQGAAPRRCALQAVQTRPPPPARGADLLGTVHCKRHSGACRCRSRRRRSRLVVRTVCHRPRLCLRRSKERFLGVASSTATPATVQWAAGGADAPFNIVSHKSPYTYTHARLQYAKYTHDNLQDTSCDGIIICGTAVPSAKERGRALCSASDANAPAAAHSPRTAPRQSSLHQHRCKEQRRGTARLQAAQQRRCRSRRWRRHRVGALIRPRLCLRRCKERRRGLQAAQPRPLQRH
jgi:hypothetical protein